MTRVAGSWLDELRVAVDGDVVTDPGVLESYRRDESPLPDAGMPAALVSPRSMDEVAEVLRVASRARVAVVPRGAGTGLSGGANALEGCIVLSTRRMRAVQIDTADSVADVEPGALNVEVKRAAAEHGLWYAPDPSSYETSTIGGNVATNAGGLCCVRHGVTSDAVLGLEVVLSGGRIVRTGGRTRKRDAGFDLTRLFVGSEGTLGVITRATLRLRPKPPARRTILASFPKLPSAGRAVAAIAATLEPEILEVMDRRTVAAIEALHPMGLGDPGAIVLVQTLARDQDEAEAVKLALDRQGPELIVEATGAEGEMLLEARRLALPSLERLGTVLLDDVCVPIGRVTDLMACIEDIGERTTTTIGTFGHAGDGNLHPTIVFDASDEDSRMRARIAFDEIVRAALSLGGTCTGEHGVGLLKRSFLPSELGDAVLDLHRRIKMALDPDGILNPGKAF